MKLLYDKHKLAKEGEYNDRNLVQCRCGKHYYPSKKMLIEFLKQFKDVKATADIWTHSDIPSGKVIIHCEISYFVEKGEGFAENSETRKERCIHALLKEYNFPSLPPDFMEWLQRKGKQQITLAELVEEYEKWKCVRERGNANR